MSGTPLCEWGAFPDGYPNYTNLRQRGTAGRTPFLWDLSTRVSYEPPRATRATWRPKLTLDLLHIASRRNAVDYDQVHYFDVDSSGNQVNPNPTYGEAIRYQPPMAIRIGMEIRFR